MVTAASLAQATEALNGADVNLFCRNTHLKKGQQTFFFCFFF